MEQEVGKPATSGGKPLAIQAISEALTRQIGNVFGTQILWLESLDSLTRGGPQNQDIPLREPDDLKQLRDELTGRDDISFNV